MSVTCLKKKRKLKIPLQTLPIIENIPVDVGMKSEVGVASISLPAKSIGRHCYMYMHAHAHQKDMAY